MSGTIARVESSLLAPIALLIAVIAMFIGVAAFFRRHNHDGEHLNQLVQNHYDEFIDFRDIARKWINRERTRAARETNAAERELPAAPQSDQEVKAHLRRLDRISRGVEVDG